MSPSNSPPTVTRRRFLAIGFSASGVALLAACNAPVPAAPPAAAVATAAPAAAATPAAPVAEAKPAGASPITLQFVSVVSTDSPPGKSRLKVIDKYKQAKPNVTVEYEYLPYSDFMAQLVTRALAGDAPPIVQGGQHTQQFAIAKALVELGPFMDRDQVKKEDYWDALWETAVYNGKTYAFPFTIDTRMVYYNEDLYTKMGIKVPETWDDMAAMTKPAKDLGISAWTFLMNSDYSGIWETGTNFVNTNGGSYITVGDGGVAKANLTSPEVVEALDFLGKLIKDGATPPSVLTDGGAESQALFETGKASSYYIGNWMIRSFDDEKAAGNMAFTPKLAHHPKSKKLASAAGGWLWYVFNTIKDPEAGWDMIKFFNQPDNVNEGWPDSLPPGKADMKLSLWADEPRNQFVSEVLDYSSWVITPVAGWFEILPVIWRNCMKAFSGQASTQEAMAQGNKELQDILDKGHNALIGK